MDFQRDYILRLIQMMGDFMRRVGELMDDLERMHLLDDKARELCGMTLETAHCLTTNSLIELLEPLPRFMMSELLTAEADACHPDIERERELRLKALRLLATLHDQPNLCGLRDVRLRELKRATLPLLTAEDLMNCARFFAQAERYDEMEDALFQALPLTDEATREADRGEAIRMLRRAARSTERALALCGMTARELRESAHELGDAIHEIPKEQENPE